MRALVSRNTREGLEVLWRMKNGGVVNIIDGPFRWTEWAFPGTDFSGGPKQRDETMTRGGRVSKDKKPVACSLSLLRIVWRSGWRWWGSLVFFGRDLQSCKGKAPSSSPVREKLRRLKNKKLTCAHTFTHTHTHTEKHTSVQEACFRRPVS